MSSFLAGLGLGLSLIVAIGAQNVFVLRQGIRREHVAAVAALCAGSDAVLIALGISGIGAVTGALPWLLPAVRWLGAAFLVGYGLLAARRALRPSGEALLIEEAGPVPAGAGAAMPAPAPTVATVILTGLALTWLNPHVYLDTVFLLGSIGATHGDQRWVFGLGAVVASTIWFFGLGYGARLLGRRLSSVRAWRVLDALIAVVMVGLGVSLVV